MRYPDYLRSDKWRQKRSAVMYRAGGRCEFCGAPAEHVHHVRYPKHLGTEPLDDLVALCANCHEKSHGIRGEANMREMIQRDFEGQAIACFVEDSGVWFDYSSICQGLGMLDARGKVEQRTASALWRRLDDDERRIEQIPDERGNLINRYFVSKSGAYSVAILSDTPKGNRFRRALTHEILPSIDKTGMYVAPGRQAIDVLRAHYAVLEEHEGRLTHVELRVEQLENKPAALPSPEVAITVANYAVKVGLDCLTQEQKKRIGQTCHAICKEMGIDPKTLDKVYAGQWPQTLWPLEVVRRAFERHALVAEQ